MTTPPPEGSVPIVTPTSEETRAINKALSDEEIRSLAQQLLKSGQLGFEPSTLVKGVVTAFDFLGSPPTLTVEISGDTTVSISNVRVINTYSPQVGHTVLLAKQGSDIVVIGHIAAVSAYKLGEDWVRATLTNGSHGGNSNGDIYYRRILDHGSWKMQWRGGWNTSGTLMINTANALTSEFRPSSKRSVLCARHIQTGATAAQWDFHSDGRVELVGSIQTANSAVATGDIGTIGSHYHGIGAVGSHSHPTPGTSANGGHDHGGGTSSNGGHDHPFYGGSHTHSVSSPTWVSLNGVEYFL